MNETTNLYNPSKIGPIHVVVRFEKYFPQSAFANRIVFRVEFVETMKCISVLLEENIYVKYLLHISFPRKRRNNIMYTHTFFVI